MLIKRLVHRWVLMEGEGGDAPAGGAPAAAPAAPATADAPAAAPAAPAAAPASPAAPETPASPLDALKPPASIVGESGDTPAEPKESDQPADKPTDAPVEDKPIEYTDFTLPEGFTADAEQMSAFKEAAAGAKLSQEQAQAFVDLHQQALQKAATAPYEQWRDTQKAWQDEIKADPEFGGAKLETETIPSIARAIKAFSPDAEAEKALRQAFHFTGAGNNPEMIRFMARIGQSLAEGTHVAGKPTSGDGGRSAAEKLYPSTVAKSGQS